MLQRTAQIETRRIAQHHSRQQQLFRLLSLVDALQARKLQAIVDAFDFAQALGMHGNDLATFLMRHGDDIGDVVFALGVVIGEIRQPALEVCSAGDQDPGVDFLDLALRLAGIFVLNDARHLAIFTGNAAVAGWIIQLHRQQTNPALRLRGAQAL